MLPKQLGLGNSQFFTRCLRSYSRIVKATEPVKAVVGLRREDNSVWERRAPLAPSHVKSLVRKGFKFLVQPSNRRAYPMQEYARAGAIIAEDLSEATVIIGVKQVPIDLLEPNKTYVFFSHTIKAQEANMPLLDAILEKDIRLIDYEKILDDDGLRLVAFGKYAGVAGMINILHGLGIRLLALGHHTPFMHIGLAHNYRNSDMARQAIRDAGYEISLGLMPKSLGPLTFVFTGSGNVSQGAQEMFVELPYEYVSPDHLASVAQHGSINKVYACEVSREHHLVNKDGEYNADEYEEHPERYVSVFSRKIAPYTSVLVNGIYWGPNSPRLLKIPDAKILLRPTETPWLPSSLGCPHLPHRLMAICDISADPGGSIEFMKKTTTIDAPFELYDADQNIHTDSFSGPGVLICSIDNMPAQIPREATDFFGGMLLPYMPEIAISNARAPFEDYPASRIIKDAVIASNGELTNKYKYIADLRTKRQGSKQKTPSSLATGGKKILILGSGYVSAPVVDYLSRCKDISITVASQIRGEIDSLASKFPNTTPVLMELQRSHEDVENLIVQHDLVISLLPYILHPEVAQMCIKHKTNMVTASYRSPAMMALNEAAKKAGVTIVNEVGVDPGIDHLLAIECFDEVKDKGGKVISFVSWCGGLPAPESANNPLRYKFSWSPRGVLANVLSSAKWLQDGEIMEVPAGGALLDSIQKINFIPGFNLEGFANRDSTQYTSIYGIESAKTMLRGTLRYKGFSNAMKGLVQMGLISETVHPLLHPSGSDITWRDLVCELVGQKKDILLDSLKDLVYKKVGQDELRLNAIEQLGLFDGELVDKKGTPLDTLSNYLSKRLVYDPTERDIIIMRHEIGIEWSDRSREQENVDFVVYGEPFGYTAMAATVGYPTAIAAKMVLDGEIQEKGCILPFSRSIYKPMLSRLQALNLFAKSNTVPLKSNTLFGGIESVASFSPMHEAPQISVNTKPK